MSHKPFRTLNVLMGNEQHKSCWDCENIRVNDFPNRHCVIYPGEHIWAGNFENEIDERRLSKQIELTKADTCPSYQLDAFHIQGK